VAEPIEEKILEIDRHNLTGEFAEQAKRFFFWARRYEKEAEVLETMEMHLEILEASLDDSIRRKAREAGERLSEPHVAARVKRSAVWKTMKKQILNKRREVKELKALTKGFEHRKEMLIQLGSYEKKEMDHLGFRMKASKSG
jgi:hypothetical protein